MSTKRLLVLLILILAVPFVVSAANKGEKLKTKSSVSKAETTKSKSTDVKKTETTIKSSVESSDIKEITPAIIIPQEVTEETSVHVPKVSPAAGETINWQVISSGGTNASSTSYQLLGTFGQTAVGMGSSSTYQLLHGFWQDFGGSGGSCCGQYTGGYPGNTNSDIAGLRDLADITKLIDNVYITKVPLTCPENGNVNGDSAGLVDLADITKLIDHVYISKAEVPVCI